MSIVGSIVFFLRALHGNRAAIAAHPTARWTAQQVIEAFPFARDARGQLPGFVRLELSVRTAILPPGLLRISITAYPAG